MVCYSVTCYVLRVTCIYLKSQDCSSSCAKHAQYDKNEKHQFFPLRLCKKYLSNFTNLSPLCSESIEMPPDRHLKHLLIRDTKLCVQQEMRVLITRSRVDRYNKKGNIVLLMKMIAHRYYDIAYSGPQELGVLGVPQHPPIFLEIRKKRAFSTPNTSRQWA